MGIRDAIDELTAEALELSDGELLAEWRSAGARLEDARPREFADRYQHLMSAIPDAPRFVPTLDRWTELGTILIRSPKTRVVVAKTAVLIHIDQNRIEAEQVS